ncbi:hypothetical protein GGH95_001199, partial [Coemansia sp. RSA 1836]
LLCPRFTRFVEVQRYWTAFNMLLAEALKSEPYCDYAERLRPLALSDISTSI